MTILYDPQIFTTQRQGGVSRYFANLIQDMDKKGENISCPLIFSARFNENIYLSKIRHCIKEESKIHPILDRTDQILHGAWKRKFRSWAENVTYKSCRAEIAHAGQFCQCTPWFLSHPRLVVTVHDMIHETILLKRANPLPDWQTYSNNKRRYIDHSQLIIAISEHTKNELAREWHIDENRIRVIHHSNPFENIDIPDAEPVPPYILYVGARDFYKNFSRFLQAVAPLLGENQALSIVCTGLPTFSREENELIRGLHLENRIQTKIVNDDELVRLYRNARVFVFPSLAEGFGLPLLEAFSCRCPVCCSNTSCFPEIAGEAASYFDPTSVTSMRDAISRVINDNAYRESLIEKGAHRATKFTHEKTSQLTWQVYQEVINSSSQI